MRCECLDGGHDDGTGTCFCGRPIEGREQRLSEEELRLVLEMYYRGDHNCGDEADQLARKIERILDMG